MVKRPVDLRIVANSSDRWFERSSCKVNEGTFFATIAIPSTDETHTMTMVNSNRPKEGAAW
jgi:hypothetical protein